MKRLLFIRSIGCCFFVLGLVPALQAQTPTCQTELAEADQLYTRGWFDQSIEQLQVCLVKPDVPTSDQRQAYRLMSLNYIAKDLIEEARQNVIKLLSVVPYYEENLDEDPPAFIRLLNEIKTILPTNRPPQIVAPIPRLSLTIGQLAIERDLAADPIVFTDPEGEALRYAINAGDADVATATLSGSILKVQPGTTAGQITITIIAIDAEGSSTELSVPVTVAPAPERKKQQEKSTKPQLIDSTDFQKKLRDLESKIQKGGEVLVEFTVNERGSVEGARVIKGINASFDKDVLNIVRSLHYRPGTENGWPRRVRVRLPLRFRSR